MRHAKLAGPLALAGLVLAALDASAQGSMDQVPESVIEWDGRNSAGNVRTCNTTTALLVEGDGARIAWSARRAPNETETIYICCDAAYTKGPAATATPSPCGTPGTTGRIQLDDALPAYTNDSSAPIRCTCATSTGSASVPVQEWKR